MPTILRIGAYRFFFYSGDKDEPPHVHVQKDDNIAKFWLEPVRIHHSGGFNRRDMVKIHAMVLEHRIEFLEAWYDYFEN